MARGQSDEPVPHARRANENNNNSSKDGKSGRREESTEGTSKGNGGEDVVDGSRSPPMHRLASVPSQSSSSSSSSSSPLNSRVIPFTSVQSHAYECNGVTRGKYNWFTFIPKFLFEQFRRYANIFFLCIGLLQQIPNVSPTGRFVTIVPFTVILGLTAIKEIVEDIKRHAADDKENKSMTLVLNRMSGVFEPRQWQEVCVGDIVRVEDTKFFPSDLVLLSSSEPQGMCYIETSNLDGETNLKIRTALSCTSSYDSALRICELRGHIECEEPNRNLYDFKGNLRVENDDNIGPSAQVEQGESSVTVPLSPATLLLRGARLQNTDWIIGCVVYTGHETKLLKNSTKAPLKRSNIDKMTNNQIIFLFLILILISFISALANEVIKHDIKQHYYLADMAITSSFFYNMLTFVILYNNLIPISLLVTLEGVRFIQAFFINWDKDMYDECSSTFAMAKTSNLNEELGQIKYVFADKTGTLTRNVMAFKSCSIAGNIFDLETNVNDFDRRLLSLYSEDRHDSNNDRSSQDDFELREVYRDFLTLMACCHTVIPEMKKSNSQNLEVVDGATSVDGSSTSIFYHASSPDEKALVEGAADFGLQFVNRKPESVLLKHKMNDRVEEIEVLRVIEFTSQRKRMSIVARMPDNSLKLFVKGADTVILPRLEPSKKYKDVTVEHLEHFAQEGLRTLCLAVREVSEDFYKEWQIIFDAATTTIDESRDVEIEKAAELIERDLRLLGATAIEDKLQEGVPETIAQLLEANIQVWVLTGDKQETAINIGHSCRLLHEGMDIIVINSDSLDETRSIVTEHLSRIKHESQGRGTNSRAQIESSDRQQVALVVDGLSLTFALDHSLRKDFLELCLQCSSVVCCRVSPIQKAEMVELVQEAKLTKSSKSPPWSNLFSTSSPNISLAIGDGANDVAMIQKADVGVGISGNEGMQAANSADFSLAQFRFLSKLLFVHGAWNYNRVSKVILYSFYKNICLYIIELWFAFANAWSGQVLFERWTIGLYNIFFTAAPPIAMGLFDQHCSASTRLRHPSLYKSSQKSETFNNKTFWTWVSISVVHSVVLYALPMAIFVSSNVMWASGKTSDYLVVGNAVYTFVVIVACCKAGLSLASWNILTHVAIWGSIGFWLLFLMAYSHAWPLGLPLAPDMTGMSTMVYGSLSLFWLGLLIVPVLTLIPDVVTKALSQSVWISKSDRIRLTEVRKGNVSPLFSDNKKNGKVLANEASSLIRNVRRKFKAQERRETSNRRNSIENKSEDVGLDEMEHHGYAFSQEEHGAVSQGEYIRRYDTTRPKRTPKGESVTASLPASIRARLHRIDDDNNNNNDGTTTSALPSHRLDVARQHGGVASEVVVEDVDGRRRPDPARLVRAHRTELPSPMSVTRTNRRYAVDPEEVKPLRDGS